MTDPVRVAVSASCLARGCTWREPFSLDAERVDREARRHTGERGLQGGPGHPTVVRGVPV